MRNLSTISKRLDAFIQRIGQLSSWLIFGLVLLVASDVLLRYFFHISSIAEQELQWHILAAIAMFGSAFTFQQGEHVRVDLFYQNYNERIKILMDIFIPLLIIIPYSIFIIYLSSGYVMQSYVTGEISPDPGGLPYRYLVKALIPFGFVLILIQAFAVMLKAFTQLKGEK